MESGGVEHDINQLSSGQREVLMTYAHLEKLRPSGSIILFDEPELHLHPALQRRVITHLHRLLERGSNQIWVITHAEEIVNTTEYEALFAMTGKGSPAIERVRDRQEQINLLRQLGADIGLQLISPRILFLEGDSDLELLPRFFETLPVGVSLVGTGSKSNLMRLTPAAMSLLDQAITEGQFYFVRDRDVEDDPDAIDELERKHKGHFFVWDRYHIENYLLDEEAIYRVLADDPDIPICTSAADIYAELRAIADQRKQDVIIKHLEARLNPGLRRRLRLNSAEDVKESLVKAAEGYRKRVVMLLDDAELERQHQEVVVTLEEQWDIAWKKLCVGRDVLQTYHNRHIRSCLGYEVFRNKVARKIQELGRVPETITKIIESVTIDLDPANKEAG